MDGGNNYDKLLAGMKGKDIGLFAIIFCQLKFKCALSFCSLHVSKTAILQHIIAVCLFLLFPTCFQKGHIDAHIN